ncbi:TIGR03084 family metal-binding protein [Phaeobacter gallaeciensis]|uniref:TIGR03084 family metal-binding protein n=1 Tax=Phaeobacter gallaeciensis TaxID=60890 RepID=UPI00237FB388|nr:TIGR03084 family metal-binding protein [Phaeobacter gallaeciensis]MDE4189792.1 TIGR03084 family metal-binding protein [Phaeobacter gallaeciensis]MDE4198945.1 TIGR03084 family metal-binding protein [Phaeobacter gallaeciensis]MDE4203092.1 TIGR03084 family metal-binding protein [Phaeobacter gallaeciensis]MDE4207234.1 TIGR03084 family metal-binding protein [Phaeobacter gallaeciensis]MDE4215542.1 TIGR03084 family metal-binding protein [Phaeobacter gallaeciensis]
MQQAEDFRAESRALAAILEDLPEEAFHRPTQFKDWTIDHVLGHLHLFNVAAETSLKGEAAFAAFIGPIVQDMQSGKTILQCQFPWLDGLSGRALFEAWKAGAETCADAFAVADPKARVKWVGPDMSALSSITARQMETWAHGQEVFDLLGLERVEQDRIRNIAHLGVATYGWTFLNRGEEVLDPAPFVQLTGPSSAVWEWNTPQEDNRVVGSAVEFAQVVTQVRNIEDTALEVTGATATRWMEIAQCFAGPPEMPPSKGARHKV